MSSCGSCQCMHTMCFRCYPQVFWTWSHVYLESMWTQGFPSWSMIGSGLQYKRWGTCLGKESVSPFLQEVDVYVLCVCICVLLVRTHALHVAIHLFCDLVRGCCYRSFRVLWFEGEPRCTHTRIACRVFGCAPRCLDETVTSKSRRRKK